MKKNYVIRSASFFMMSLLFALLQVLLIFIGRIADASIFSALAIDEQSKKMLSEKMIGVFRGDLADVAIISFVAFFGAFVSMLFLMKYAEKMGFLDHPDGERKVHVSSKPVVGGMGMLAGVMVTMLYFHYEIRFSGLLPALMLIAVTGAIDDRNGISFIFRFIVQACATIMVMLSGGTVLESFGDLLGLGPLRTEGFIAWLITIFCVIGVINSINMIDGLDGLAGGVSLVAFVAFGLLSGISGRGDIVFLVTAFSGALAAFLYFNWHPARLFMGDAGSTTIGFMLAYLSIEITRHTNTVTPVVALMVMFLPVSDTIVVMSRRLMGGKSPFIPDRTHIHHQLLDLGLSQTTVVWIIVMICVASSAVAVIGAVQQVPESTLFTIWLCCFMLYCIVCIRMPSVYRVIRAIIGINITPDIREAGR